MAKKDRIVYLHRYPIEYENKIYPATKKILDLLNKKYEITYISFKTSDKIDNKLRKGIRIEELPYSVDIKNSKDKWLKTLLWYLYLPRIWKSIDRISPAMIVHKEQLPFIPYILSKKKIPLLVDIGDWWWTTLFGGSKIGLKFAQLMENFEIRLWGRSKNIFASAHSQTEAKILADRGMKFDRIRVINHPSSESTYKPVNVLKLKTELGLEQNWIVAMHGIIHPSKGYGQILEWWANIVKSHQNWKLLIIGGTIGEKWCRNKISSLGLEKNVLMTGWLKDSEEVNKYLNLADCLLVTRRNDLANQGLIPSSLFHSLSIGKPLLITGLPGLKEMVRDEIDGYSFEPDNYDSFINKLEFIYHNPEKANEVGKNGIKRGKSIFNPDKCARGFYDFIIESIEKYRLS